MVAPWDRRSSAEQRRLGSGAVATWLPAVVAAAPFHAARAEGIDPRLLADVRGLQRLAPTRERDLLADAVGGSSAVLRPTEAQVKTTADDGTIRGIARGIRRDGAQGKRDAMVQAYRPVQLHRGGVAGQLLVASSRTDLDRSHRAGARAAAVLGLRDDDVVVSAVPTGPSLDHLGVVHMAAGAGLTALHARGHGANLAEVARAAASLSTSVLVVPVGEAGAFGAGFVGAGIVLPRLRLVVTVGPPPAADVRARIAAAFADSGPGAELEVRAVHGPSAVRSLWAECAEGAHGLHTYPDLELLEVLDPLTGTPTDGHGDLTVTSVGWHGTALVRFQTGSWVDALATDPCPGCARTVPRILGDVVPHAWELPVGLGGGRRGWVDLRGVGVVAAATAGVSEWRAELRGPADEGEPDRLLVEFAGGDPGAAAALAGQVAVATGLAPELSVGLADAEVRAGIEEAGGVLADRR